MKLHWESIEATSLLSTVKYRGSIIISFVTKYFRTGTVLPVQILMLLQLVIPRKKGGRCIMYEMASCSYWYVHVNSLHVWNEACREAVKTFQPHIHYVAKRAHGTCLAPEVPKK